MTISNAASRMKRWSMSSAITITAGTSSTANRCSTGARACPAGSAPRRCRAAPIPENARPTSTRPAISIAGCCRRCIPGGSITGATVSPNSASVPADRPRFRSARATARRSTACWEARSRASSGSGRRSPPIRRPRLWSRRRVSSRTTSSSSSSTRWRSISTCATRPSAGSRPIPACPGTPPPTPR